MNPYLPIAIVLWCGLIIWLRYREIKRAVGRTLTQQMMPLEIIQFGLLGLVLGKLSAATSQLEKTLWLLVALLVPIWAIVEIIRAVSPVKAAVQVTLAPDPADRDAASWGILQGLVGFVSLLDYFSHDQSEPFRLAVSALFLASAARNFLRRFKSATLTEIGYHQLGLTLRWVDIKAYQWLDQSGPRNVLVYQRKTPWRLASLSYLSIPAISRAPIDEFLSRYVVTTSTLSVVLD